MARNPVNVEVGDLVHFKSHGEKIAGKVYFVNDDEIGVQDIWFSPYTVNRRSRSLEVFTTAKKIEEIKAGSV